MTNTNRKNDLSKDSKDTIEKIAKEELGVDTFVSQNGRDEENHYHKLRKKDIFNALREAYEIGQAEATIDSLENLKDLEEFEKDEQDTEGRMTVINTDHLKDLKEKAALYEKGAANADEEKNLTVDKAIESDHTDAETDLTVDEIATLGNRLNQSVMALRIMNSAIEFVPEASSLSTDEFAHNYFKVANLIDPMFDQIQNIISTLDETAHTLLENDEANELKGVRDNNFI